MKIIAFYLPQFHSIPENDEWWGKGFTEWVNVKKGKSLFDGHEQPKVPMNNNYYNLLDDNIKKWQIKIAKENGIYGFCFYHYWFGGKLMLEKPLEQFLSNQELDLPFCLCWANPPWTKIWAGEGSKILIDQNYGDEAQWENHFQYLLQFFKDSRYITDDGMPLLVIYDPSDIPCIKEMLNYFRQRALEEGFKGIKLAYQYYVDEREDKRLKSIFDYCIHFQPVYAQTELEAKGKTGLFIKVLKKVNSLVNRYLKLNPGDKLLHLRMANYDDVWNEILDEKIRDNKTIPGAFVNWDNTPRRGNAGRVIINGSPEKFKHYMRQLIIKAENECSTDYIFLTAWNEWSEGSYLEPDERYKDAYLRAVKEAQLEAAEI